MDTGFFSAKSHLVTPDVSRATTPVEDIESFDPSRPSLNPSNSSLLPISKIAGYPDVALKALTLHAEARASFISNHHVRVLSPMFIVSNRSHRTSFFFFLYRARFFLSPNSFLLIYPCPIPHQKKPYNGRETNIRGLDHLGIGNHAGIGCRVCSSTNLSPCVSLRKHSTKRLLRCTSRPPPTSSLASSCFPRCQLGRCGPLGAGSGTRDCGGRRDVLDEGRRR